MTPTPVPTIVPQDEWLAARLVLLAEDKTLALWRDGCDTDR
jgi:predicted dithiol-disulfide oxidoreductase (DUF899 family)